MFYLSRPGDELGTHSNALAHTPTRLPVQPPTTQVVTITSQKVVASLEGHEESVEAVAFSPAHPYLATGSLEGKLCIWETNAAFRLRHTLTHGVCTACVLFVYSVRLSCLPSHTLTHGGASSVRFVGLPVGSNRAASWIGGGLSAMLLLNVPERVGWLLFLLLYQDVRGLGVVSVRGEMMCIFRREEALSSGLRALLRSTGAIPSQAVIVLWRTPVCTATFPYYAFARVLSRIDAY